MKSTSSSIQDQKLMAARRRKQNSDLIRRMKSGETLMSFDSHSSWFPPRPVIKKDTKALEELYGKGKEDKP